MMAEDGVHVGSVSVSVVPDASRFASDLRSQVVPPAEQIGREVAQRVADPIGKAVTDAIVKGIGDGVGRGLGPAGVGGAKVGGAFADTFRARVDAALRDLPTPKVGVDATEADAELADIRARLAALGDVRVGVDLGADEALAELDSLKARLDELGARSPDIAVRVDAAKASADLAAVRAEVDALDGDTAHIDVDTSAATAGVSTMTAAIVGLGPALIPVGAAAAAGIGGIVTAAASGAAGLGVLTLGLSAVTNAVGLLGKEHTAAAQDAARTAAAAGTSAAAQVSAANQVASATASLAMARTNAAQQEIAASEAVTRAQYAKTQADQQEANAQKQLNNAREQAARDLESAANRAVDSQLAAKQAAIDVTNAEATYTATLKNASSTQLQRQQAALDLAKAQQSLVEANQQATQAAQDNTAAQKAGVNGAPAVVAAAQAITTARHGQQQAGQALTDAERAQALQRAQAAFTIAQAQRAVSSALAAQAKAAQGSGTAGASAMAAIQASLAKVNPVVLAFAGYVTGTLEPAFNRLKTAAAVGFLPGLEAGLKAVQPLMAPVQAFVSGLARTMGDLFAAAGKALTSPFWVGFFAYVAQTAGPTLTIMAHTIGDVATGFAGLMQAFAPVVTQMGRGIASLAGHFAEFGANAGTNSGVQSFLRYVEHVGPEVVKTIGALAVTIGHIAAALAPIGVVALAVVGAFARFVDVIPTPVLTALLAVAIPLTVAIWGIGLAVGAWAAAQVALNALMVAFDAIPVVAVVVGIIAAVALLAFGIYELVKHWDAVWGAIKAATSAAWRDVIRPVFNAIVGAAQATGRFFTGPFVGAFVAAWSAVKGAAGAAVSWVTGKFDALVGFFTKMPGRIAKAAHGMWDGIKTAFRDVINWIIGKWNGLQFSVGIPHKVFGIPIPGGGDSIDIGTPDIPYLASGGVAQAATLGVFGEAGREAILPLTDPRAMQQIADAIGGAGRGGKHMEVHELHVHQVAPAPLDRSLPKAMRRMEFELSL